ncbi:hypothetical protein SAMN04490248_14110 [Salinihabitans flavidus]|uniref:Uncharacterized protein n=1 Tax=Salinihabitans flavidus TaxID=569882 RepID=A0A1H8W303_9RHOB|nr:DUF2194 domain-containing protein [Salinihabitans flavidus]SEP22000.1 hypothetical protein SAMN04490248_14110 [Salinihabitans flavidus]
MSLHFKKILILTNSNDQPGAVVADNTVAVLRYAQLEHVIVDIGPETTFPDLAEFDVILICTENVQDLPASSAQKVIDFVCKGGGLGVLYRCTHDDLNTLFGISPPELRSAYITPDYGEEGLRFPSRALPAFAGLTLDAADMGGHAMLDLWILRDVEIIATTMSSKPVAWSNSFGDGRVIYWNTGFLGEKRARGLITETIQCLRPIAVISLANASVLQVDDFPAPLSDTLHGAVADEFPEIMASEFYCTIWYPDLITLAETVGKPLSLFCMFDYTNRTTPPFAPWRNAALEAGAGNPDTDTFVAGRVLPPAEMGLHGFNHLTLTNSAWPDHTAMKASLKAALTIWDEMGFGPAPTAYVPPNNEYDRVGAAALRAACPTVRVISGSYIGVSEALGGNREFGPEPWEPSLFCLPRATSGHECKMETLFDAASQIATFGTWTHFIHADDICDSPAQGAATSGHRNPRNLPWRGGASNPGLLNELTLLLHTMKRRFPWLRGMTTTAAADTVASFFKSPWAVSVEYTQVRIVGVQGSHYQVRLNGNPRPRIRKCNGARVLHHEHATDYSLYFIAQEADEVRIEISCQTRISRIKRNLRRLVST